MKNKIETNEYNPPCPPLRKGVIEVATSLFTKIGYLIKRNLATPIPPFAKGDKGGFLLLLLLSSCTFSFTEDKLSELATMLNLSKPQGEKEATIIIQCDEDTPTGVKSLRGQVMDFDSNAPIVNAFVSSKVSTEVYATDAEGKFKIQKVGTETTTIILGVTAENYKSLSRAVEFKCQNMNALIYLPRETSPVTNPAFTPDNAPTASCIFATSYYGGCKL